MKNMQSCNHAKKLLKRPFAPNKYYIFTAVKLILWTSAGVGLFLELLLPGDEVSERKNQPFLLHIFCMILTINLHPGKWTLQDSLRMILMLHLNVERACFSEYEFKTFFKWQINFDLKTDFR